MAQHKEYTFLEAFKGRDDLRVYGDNGLLLFALALKLEIDDLEAIADRSLTDGSNDKKCDLVFVDSELGVAVIGQGYFAQTVRPAAKSQKAQDLNTAVGWLFSRSLESLPEILRPAATELRTALDEGKIKRLEIWYVHNLPESINVQDELNTVALTARNAIRSSFPRHEVDVLPQEIGLDTLETLYLRLRSSILVTAEFEVETQGGYVLEAEKWDAYATAVPASWLHNIYKEYGEKLFSANIRGYLGSREADVNINNGIKKSALSNADDFWAFNNGITALVHNFEVEENNNTVQIIGLSIVNGAQTTGAIGSLPQSPRQNTHVPARFIKCSDEELVYDIIRFNNSQNKIEAADFRSSDHIQTRLREEFQSFASVDYTGGRRGGADDIIRRRPNLISSYTVAQALTAFHGNPVLAYNRKSEIWKSNNYYSNVFNDNTHADHILFVYSLLETITEQKTALMKKSKSGAEIATQEQEKLDFLRTRGANFLLVYTISSCLEIILGQPITSRFNLRFHEANSYGNYSKIWRPIVISIMAFYKQLEKPLTNSLKSNEEVNSAVDLVKAIIDSTKQSNKVIYDTFAQKVQISVRVS